MASVQGGVGPPSLGLTPAGMDGEPLKRLPSDNSLNRFV